jgi:hypothetical protein
MPGERRARESAFLKLQIQSEDLEDLVVAMHRTVNVPGRVILEGGSALPPVTAAYPPVRILVRLADEGPPGSASTMDATVMQRGTFTLAGVLSANSPTSCLAPRNTVTASRIWYQLAKSGSPFHRRHHPPLPVRDGVSYGARVASNFGRAALPERSPRSERRSAASQPRDPPSRLRRYGEARRSGGTVPASMRAEWSGPCAAA